MPEAPAILVLALVALLGATLQSALGFGFAVFAAPIFLGLLDSAGAIQVLVVLHVVLSAIVVPRLWQGVPARLLGRLMAGSILGFPIGLALYLHMDIQTLKLAVGIATVAFTLLLIQRARPTAAHVSAPEARAVEFRAAHALCIGLVSGAMTAVLVMPGPIAMLYLRALGLEKQASRAASLTFFAFCYVMAAALHAAVAGIKPESWWLSLLLLPSVLAGSLAGHAAAGHLSEERFQRAVLCLLIVSGLYAIWAALR